jgi:hypothetical protein
VHPAVIDLDLAPPAPASRPRPGAGAVSPSAPAAVRSFAGRLPGSDLSLHVTADVAGDVIAYATDGRGVAVWFAGRRAGDRLDLAAGPDRLVADLAAGPDRVVADLAAGPDRVAADVGPGAVEIALTVEHRTHRATLPRVRRGGLFAARSVTAGGAEVAGWIVHDDGAVTAGRPALAATGPVTAGRPTTAAKGVTVRVDRLTRKWGRLAPAVRTLIGPPR